MPNVRSIVKYLATVFLVLTLWSAVAAVAHHHPNGTESAKCSVCVAAHSAAPKVAASLAKTTFSSVAIFHAKSVSTKERFVVFALNVRPPPATV
jgi:hypothetical protein